MKYAMIVEATAATASWRAGAILDHGGAGESS
jgi:hypothetical protein